MTPPSPITPISGDDARALLAQAILDRLGSTWDDPETGWSVISRTDFAARLTNGRRVLDFYVDLLGEVSVTEKPVTTEDRGRIIAWLLLVIMMMAAVFLARAVGFLP
jgi:hypothetical protein